MSQLGPLARLGPQVPPAQAAARLVAVAAPCAGPSYGLAGRPHTRRPTRSPCPRTPVHLDPSPNTLPHKGEGEVTAQTPATCVDAVALKRGRASSLPPTQRLDDLHRIACAERVGHVEDLGAVDEEAHMRPYLVLLVDHAEADARILPVEIGQQLGEAGACRLDLAPLRVGAQGPRNQHPHPIAAASTA